MDELVDDGDEIVCLRVVEKDSKIASDSSVEEGKYRQEAEKLFKQVIQKNSQDEKAISLVLELAIGRVQEIIQRMVSVSITSPRRTDLTRSDPNLRACPSHRRYPRSKHEQHARTATRVCVKVLFAAIANPSYRCTCFCQARKEEKEAPCRSDEAQL